MLRRVWNHPALWLSGVVLWAVVLFNLSAKALPAGALPPIPHVDKIAHLTYFTLGSLCFGRLLWVGKPQWRVGRVILACVLFAATVGLLDEYHQSFTPGRSGNDLGDGLADTLGGLVGGLLACWLGGGRRPAADQQPS